MRLLDFQVRRARAARGAGAPLPLGPGPKPWCRVPAPALFPNYRLGFLDCPWSCLAFLPA